VEEGKALTDNPPDVIMQEVKGRISRITASE
jgi:hypothetical protein